MRIRICKADAIQLTKIEACKRNIKHPAIASMEQNFGETMPQLRASCILAALPGAHALGRVHSHHVESITTWLVETEIVSVLEEQYFIAQRRGKSWRRVVADFGKILSENL